MVKVYPAIIHEEKGGYWMEFPDLEGCFTNGDTMEQLMGMAQEAMGLHLVTLLEDGVAVPGASNISDMDIPDGCQATYVVTEINQYRRDTKPVKKMLSLPAWLAKEAEERNISLSKVLQEALKEKMGLA